MRPRLPSPAMVVAVAALIAATTGSAIAANTYLITSTKQISPSVLKKLRGHAGPKGATGAAGAPGKNGAMGAIGSPGAPGTNGTNGTNGTSGPLTSGQTETGVFAGGGGSSTGGFINVSFSFTQPLAAALDGAHVIETVSSATHCPGAGQADPGYLCVYRTGYSFVTVLAPYNPQNGTAGAGRFGSALFYTITASGSFVYGTWAVTAP
jgi:hypothetical protein